MGVRSDELRPREEGQMDEQIAGQRWNRRLQGQGVRWYATIGVLTLGTLSACQSSSGPSAAELTPVAQYFADHGGLSLSGNPKRPCLRGVNLEKTVLGGLFGGGATAVVQFIKTNDLATVTLTPDGTGRTEATIIPKDAGKAHWLSDGSSSYYCFGRFAVMKVEPVADAKPTTAGSSEPYLIPGTDAYSTRITYKWDDVPPELLAALKETPNVLIPGSMSPDDYGVEKTIVTLLPGKTENIQLNQ